MAWFLGIHIVGYIEVYGLVPGNYIPGYIEEYGLVPGNTSMIDQDPD